MNDLSEDPGDAKDDPSVEEISEKVEDSEKENIDGIKEDPREKETSELSEKIEDLGEKNISQAKEDPNKENIDGIKEDPREKETSELSEKIEDLGEKNISQAEEDPNMSEISEQIKDPVEKNVSEEKEHPNKNEISEKKDNDKTEASEDVKREVAVSEEPKPKEESERDEMVKEDHGNRGKEKGENNTGEEAGAKEVLGKGTKKKEKGKKTDGKKKKKNKKKKKPKEKKLSKKELARLKQELMELAHAEKVETRLKRKREFEKRREEHVKEMQAKEEKLDEEMNLREIHLPQSAEIFTKQDDLFHEWEMEQKEKDEWETFLRCDPLPLPYDVPGLNTYLFLWREEKNAFLPLEDKVSRIEEVLKLLTMVDDFLDNPVGATERLISLVVEVRDDIRTELQMHLDMSSYVILRQLDQMEGEGRIMGEPEVRRYKCKPGPDISLFLWASVIASSTTAFEPAPSSAYACDFPDLGKNVQLPPHVVQPENPGVPRPELALRALHVSYDHYSARCLTIADPEFPEDFTISLLEVAQREREERMKRKEAAELAQQKRNLEEASKGVSRREEGYSDGEYGTEAASSPSPLEESALLSSVTPSPPPSIDPGRRPFKDRRIHDLVGGMTEEEESYLETEAGRKFWELLFLSERELVELAGDEKFIDMVESLNPPWSDEMRDLYEKRMKKYGVSIPLNSIAFGHRLEPKEQEVIRARQMRSGPLLSDVLASKERMLEAEAKHKEEDEGKGAEPAVADDLVAKPGKVQVQEAEVQYSDSSEESLPVFKKIQKLKKVKRLEENPEAEVEDEKDSKPKTELESEPTSPTGSSDSDSDSDSDDAAENSSEKATTTSTGGGEAGDEEEATDEEVGAGSGSSGSSGSSSEGEGDEWSPEGEFDTSGTDEGLGEDAWRNEWTKRKAKGGKGKAKAERKPKVLEEKESGKKSPKKKGKSPKKGAKKGSKKGSPKKKGKKKGKKKEEPPLSSPLTPNTPEDTWVVDEREDLEREKEREKEYGKELRARMIVETEHGELNLRRFAILGGVTHLDLLMHPPQPYQLYNSTMTLTELSQSTGWLRNIHVPPREYVATVAPKKGASGPVAVSGVFWPFPVAASAILLFLLLHPCTADDGDGATQQLCPTRISSKYVGWVTVDGRIAGFTYGAQAMDEKCTPFYFQRNVSSCKFCGSTAAGVCNGEYMTNLPDVSLYPKDIRYLQVTESDIKSVPAEAFRGLQLEHIEIDNNNKLEGNLDERAFLGIVGLRRLNITRSGLRIINIKWLRGLKDLEVLSLEDNDIEYECGINRLSSPEDPLQGKLSREKQLLCSNCDVEELVPRLLKLNLAKNKISCLAKQNFEWLKDTNLTSLSLRGISVSSVENGTFLVVSKTLRELDITDATLDDDILLIPLLSSFNGSDSSLEELSFSYLGLNRVPHEALKLVSHSLLSLSLYGNNFHTIHEDSFPLMHKLQELDLRYCDIKNIDPFSFNSLPRIKTLLLSHNRISHVDGIFLGLNFLQNLDFSNNLGLEASLMNHHISQKQNYSLSLMSQEFSNVIFPNSLINLDLSFTEIEEINSITFEGLSKLQYLSICYSKIHNIVNFSVPFRDLKNLNTLDLSGNPWLEMNLSSWIFEGLFSLKELYLDLISNGKSYGYSLKSFSISGSESPFNSLENLRLLSMKQNNIHTLNQSIFSPLTKLESLYLSNNHLISWDAPLFSGNKNLKILTMHENQISYISDSMLNEFQSLSQMSLYGNPILCNCEVRKFSELAKSGKIDVVGWNESGSYMCIDKSKKNYKAFDGDWSESEACMKDNGHDSGDTNSDNNDGSSKNSFSVASWSTSMTYILIICACSALFLVTVVYRKWSYVQYIGQLIKSVAVIRLRSEGKCASGYMYNYDVFVSYCDHDRDWVLTELLPKLEMKSSNAGSSKQPGPAFKVCLHERDFQVGSSILENIISCMDNSRMVLLVVSSTFLSSQWCQFEMQLAQHRLLETRRDDLLLVFLEEIPRKKRPKTLHYLMVTKTYLVWNEETKDLFWKRLRFAIKPNPTENDKSISSFP